MCSNRRMLNLIVFQRYYILQWMSSQISTRVWFIRLSSLPARLYCATMVTRPARPTQQTDHPLISLLDTSDNVHQVYVMSSSCAARCGCWLINLRPCQHDDGFMDGRSQIKVHAHRRTDTGSSAQSSLAVTHPSTNRARRYLTSVIESPSKHWSPPRT